METPALEQLDTHNRTGYVLPTTVRLDNLTVIFITYTMINFGEYCSGICKKMVLRIV